MWNMLWGCNARQAFPYCLSYASLVEWENHLVCQQLDWKMFLGEETSPQEGPDEHQISLLHEKMDIK